MPTPSGFLEIISRAEIFPMKLIFSVAVTNLFTQLLYHLFPILDKKSVAIFYAAILDDVIDPQQTLNGTKWSYLVDIH